MADYIFNIPGTGCDDKQIGSFSVEDCGQITSISTNSTWADVSISATTDGKILLSVPENSDVTNGRSEDVTITYTINDSTDSIIVSLCQANKHGDTPEPPGPTTPKAVMTMKSGGIIQVDCGESSSELTKTELENASVTLGEVKKAEFKSCISNFDANLNFASNENLTECTFANDIGVTFIPNYFLKGTKITTIDIPTGVTSIGVEAFALCDQITGYTIANDNVITTIKKSCFSGCTNLRSAVIPDGLTEINEGVFNKCYKLESVNIPSGIQSIGKRAFENCSGMTAVTIENTSANPSALKTIGNESFESCYGLKKIEFPKSLETIEDSAFSGCTGITSATFESGCEISFIGASAFNTCKSLRTITIPNTVTEIKNETFRYCSGLTSVTLGTGTTSIGKFSFDRCSSLPSVSIPNTVESIGNYAFDYCTSLTSITFNNSTALKTIEGYVFDGCTALTSITIPDSVTEIGIYCFWGCDALKAINTSAGNNRLPSQVTEVGAGTFYRSALESITLHEGITKIGHSAFGLTKLTTVTIPSTVTELGTYAFNNCTSLTAVTVNATTPPTIINDGTGTLDPNQPFIACNNLTSIKVPSGCANAYKSATGWSNYARIIV